MKFLMTTIALVGALAFAGTAMASPSKTTSINTTLAATGCGIAGTDCGVGGGGSCLCFAPFWNFGGRANLSSRLGSFTFAGLYEEGYFPTDPVSDPASYSGSFTYYRRLDLVFKAANGDKLVLESSSSSTTAPSTTLADGGTVSGTWTVDREQQHGAVLAFQRFRYVQSVRDGPGDVRELCLALTGSLTFS